MSCLALVLTGSASGREPVPQPSGVSQMIVPEKLRDARIEIASVTCTGEGSCKAYQIAINRDGTGDMIFYRNGQREVRRFRMSPFAFRRIQIRFEELRPAADVSASEFDRNLHRPCDHCAFTEYARVHWHRDDGKVHEFTAHSYLPNDGRMDNLLEAQIDLLEGMLPSLLGHP